MEQSSPDTCFTDAMIDLELLGLDYGRPILQIGVCLFSLASADEVFERHAFSVRVDTSCNNNACPETQAWWLRTDVELFEELLAASVDSGQDLPEAMRRLNDFLAPYELSRFWADYPAFDIAHLQLAMQRHGIAPVWLHRQVHGSSDVKLLCRMLLGAERSVPEHPGRRDHEAGSDALQQAMELKAWFRQLVDAMPGAEAMLPSFQRTSQPERDCAH
jgi:hypothetical protein